MRLILSISLVIILFAPSPLFAETKEIVSEGTYNMGDGETPSVAESRALLKAKQIALEQAGTYVESYSKVKNLTLTQDEIQVLASGLMEVEVLDKKRTVVGEGINFWVKIKAKVNPDNIEEMAKRVKEKSTVEDYKRIQEAYEKNQKEIEYLKKQLTGVKEVERKKTVEVQIAQEEKIFEANEWYEKGNILSINEEFDRAIEAYTNAIELYPLADVYIARAFAYADKKQDDRALKDINEAIALNPKNIYAYVVRGEIYLLAGRHDMAIKDLNKAIMSKDLKTGTFAAQAVYALRGAAYYYKHQLNKAISDFSKAISKNSKDVISYKYRADAYKIMGQYDKTIVDLSTVITIAPGDAKAYADRGFAYLAKKQYGEALADCNKAISIQPNLAQAYATRGFVYALTNNEEKAIPDFQKACNMGDKYGCKGLLTALKNQGAL